MSQTITMRLPEETAEWLKTSARHAGRSVSELGATLFEEARRVSEFAEIEFRTFSGERLACLKGGLRIWKIIRTAQDYGMDAPKTAAHFELPLWRIQAAFQYYEAFPQETDDAIAAAQSPGFQTLLRKLPRMELQAVSTQEVSTQEVSTQDTSAQDISVPEIAVPEIAAQEIAAKEPTA